MNMDSVIYIGYDGHAYSQLDMMRSFYLYTGKKPDDFWGEYVRFLNGRFGKSIEKYLPCTIENLIAYDRKVRAIFLYHKLHKRREYRFLKSAPQYKPLQTTAFSETNFRKFFSFFSLQFITFSPDNFQISRVCGIDFDFFP